MITQADDEGRLRTGAHHLALAFFHDVSLTPEIESQLHQMVRLRKIQLYKDDKNESCVSLINFASHHVSERPTPSRIQKPPHKSPSLRRVLGEDSVRKERERERERERESS